MREGVLIVWSIGAGVNAGRNNVFIWTIFTYTVVEGNRIGKPQVPVAQPWPSSTCNPSCLIQASSSTGTALFPHYVILKQISVIIFYL